MVLLIWHCTYYIVLARNRSLVLHQQTVLASVDCSLCGYSLTTQSPLGTSQKGDRVAVLHSKRFALFAYPCVYHACHWKFAFQGMFKLVVHDIWFIRDVGGKGVWNSSWSHDIWWWPSSILNWDHSGINHWGYRWRISMNRTSVYHVVILKYFKRLLTNKNGHQPTNSEHWKVFSFVGFRNFSFTNRRNGFTDRPDDETWNQVLVRLQ